jgi:hypothetical protein
MRGKAAAWAVCGGITVFGALVAASGALLASADLFVQGGVVFGIGVLGLLVVATGGGSKQLWSRLAAALAVVVVVVVAAVQLGPVLDLPMPLVTVSVVAAGTAVLVAVRALPGRADVRRPPPWVWVFVVATAGYAVWQVSRAVAVGTSPFVPALWLPLAAAGLALGAVVLAAKRGRAAALTGCGAGAVAWAAALLAGIEAETAVAATRATARLYVFIEAGRRTQSPAMVDLFPSVAANPPPMTLVTMAVLGAGLALTVAGHVRSRRR